MKRTIVGGRPPSKGRGTPFPPGIDVLLRKASVDPAFRVRLRADPEAASASIRLVLTPTERAILAAISTEELERSIDAVFVPETQRPIFRAAKAAAMVAVVLGVVVACGPIGATGARPDEPQDPPPTEEEEAAEKVALLFPRGVEVMLLKASVDTEFRALLHEDVEEAALSIGLALRDDDRTLLESITVEELDVWIDRVRVPDALRGVFEGASAEAMLEALDT